jgi:CubicO group peptidase (beta-lactamase class C family)
MMRQTLLPLVILLLATFGRPVAAQQLYFPPVNAAFPWDTITPASLHWCTGKIDSLYSFLEQENTKGFLVLKNGKIVLEKYFGTFTSDSLWYWASAGKTLTSFLAGLAQEEGFLSISDTSAKYLGTGWTGCSPLAENMITIRHQLTMTTGFDDGVPDNHCTLDTCLVCIANPGSRWAYHNAPYTLLEKVLSNATGVSMNSYTLAKLKSRTGISGVWFTIDYDNVFFSTVRSMARFGLLIQNRGTWASTPVMQDTSYFRQMVNPSQELNHSYGYLWWLNGKQDFMVPGFQIVFPGSYAPHAPADMIAGLGKNGQIVSIAPSQGLVVVRMGNPPASTGEVTMQFCDQVWEKLNDVICGAGGIQDAATGVPMKIYPNPAGGAFMIELPEAGCEVSIADITSRIVFHKRSATDRLRIETGSLIPGVYTVIVSGTNRFVSVKKLIVTMVSR